MALGWMPAHQVALLAHVRIADVEAWRARPRKHDVPLHFPRKVPLGRFTVRGPMARKVRLMVRWGYAPDRICQALSLTDGALDDFLNRLRSVRRPGMLHAPRTAKEQRATERTQQRREKARQAAAARAAERAVWVHRGALTDDADVEAPAPLAAELRRRPGRRPGRRARGFPLAPADPMA